MPVFTCPKCALTKSIDDRFINRKVRCSRCGMVSLVTAPAPDFLQPTLPNEADNYELDFVAETPSAETEPVIPVAEVRPPEIAKHAQETTQHAEQSEPTLRYARLRFWINLVYDFGPMLLVLWCFFDFMALVMLLSTADTLGIAVSASSLIGAPFVYMAMSALADLAQLAIDAEEHLRSLAAETSAK